MATTQKDITKMTASEIEEYLQQKKQEERKQILAKGEQIKKELDEYAMSKYGVSATAIFNAKKPSSMAGQYKHPTTGEVVNYSGFGKVYDWLKGSDGKPNQAYRVHAN